MNHDPGKPWAVLIIMIPSIMLMFFILGGGDFVLELVKELRRKHD